MENEHINFDDQEFEVNKEEKSNSNENLESNIDVEKLKSMILTITDISSIYDIIKKLTVHEKIYLVSNFENLLMEIAKDELQKMNVIDMSGNILENVDIDSLDIVKKINKIIEVINDETILFFTNEEIANLDIEHYKDNKNFLLYLQSAYDIPLEIKPYFMMNSNELVYLIDNNKIDVNKITGSIISEKIESYYFYIIDYIKSKNETLYKAILERAKVDGEIAKAFVKTSQKEISDMYDMQIEDERGIKVTLLDYAINNGYFYLFDEIARKNTFVASKLLEKGYTEFATKMSLDMLKSTIRINDVETTILDYLLTMDDSITMENIINFAKTDEMVAKKILKKGCYTFVYNASPEVLLSSFDENRTLYDYIVETCDVEQLHEMRLVGKNETFDLNWLFNQEFVIQNRFEKLGLIPQDIYKQALGSEKSLKKIKSITGWENHYTKKELNYINYVTNDNIQSPLFNKGDKTISEQIELYITENGFTEKFYRESLNSIANIKALIETEKWQEHYNKKEINYINYICTAKIPSEIFNFQQLSISEKIELYIADDGFTEKFYRDSLSTIETVKAISEIENWQEHYSEKERQYINYMCNSKIVSPLFTSFYLPVSKQIELYITENGFTERFYRDSLSTVGTVKAISEIENWREHYNKKELNYVEHILENYPIASPLLTESNLIVDQKIELYFNEDGFTERFYRDSLNSFENIKYLPKIKNWQLHYNKKEINYINCINKPNNFSPLFNNESLSIVEQIELYITEDGFTEKFYKDSLQSAECIEVIFKIKDWQEHYTEKEVTFIETLNNLKDKSIKESFFTFVHENFDNIEKEQIEKISEIFTKIECSNSLELRRVRNEITKILLTKTSNIEEEFYKIESIFIKDNLPYVGKVFKVFDLLHPDFSDFNFSSYSVISPILKQESSGYHNSLYRKIVVLSDLIKASFGSNNLSIQEYLNNIEVSTSIYESINNETRTLDSLSIEELSELNKFREHLITLYNNTLLSKKHDFEFVQSDNLIDDINTLVLKISPNGTVNYNLADRIVSMFASTIGINTLNDAKNYIKAKIKFAHDRNVASAENTFTLEKGDLVKGLRSEGINYLRNILQNGSVSCEYLGDSAGSDSTPLDTDLSIIESETGNIREKMYGLAANGYGPIYIVLKNDDRFITTRTNDGEIKEKYSINDALNKIELFYTGVAGRDHYGIRTGFASSEINYILVEQNDPRIGLEIAINGFYIPVVDMNGNLLFSPKNYETLREKMNGLSYYGMGNYIIDESAHKLSSEISNIVSAMDENKHETKRKSDLIKKKLMSGAAKLNLGIKENIDLSQNTLILFNTGSTGRFTNLPGDGDFDYTMQVDREIYADAQKMEELRKRLIESLNDGNEMKFDVISGDIRELKTILTDENGNQYPVEIDITFTPKTDRTEYASDICVTDRLNSIESTEERNIVKANIILAKQFLKSIGAYKPARKFPEQGGMGGIGVENWILQNGGTLYSAAKSFMEVANACTSFEEFQSKYSLPNFGYNHMAYKRGQYPHDDYIKNMNETGFKKMKEALSIYVKKYEENVDNPVMETVRELGLLDSYSKVSTVVTSAVINSESQTKTIESDSKLVKRAPLNDRDNRRRRSFTHSDSNGNNNIAPSKSSEISLYNKFKAIIDLGNVALFEKTILESKEHMDDMQIILSQMSKEDLNTLYAMFGLSTFRSRNYQNFTGDNLVVFNIGNINSSFGIMNNYFLFDNLTGRCYSIMTETDIFNSDFSNNQIVSWLNNDMLTRAKNELFGYVGCLGLNGMHYNNVQFVEYLEKRNSLNSNEFLLYRDLIKSLNENDVNLFIIGVSYSDYKEMFKVFECLSISEKKAFINFLECSDFIRKSYSRDDGSDITVFNVSNITKIDDEFVNRYFVLDSKSGEIYPIITETDILSSTYSDEQITNWLSSDNLREENAYSMGYVGCLTETGEINKNRAISYYVHQNSTLKKSSTTEFFEKHGDFNEMTYGVAQDTFYNMMEFIDGKGKRMSYREAMSKCEEAEKKKKPYPSFVKECTYDYFILKENVMRKYGFSSIDASRLLTCIDHTGACSYATICSQIFDYFKNDPKKFGKLFGYSMYREGPDNKKVLNAENLLIDLYVFANDIDNGGKLICKDYNGRHYLNSGVFTAEVDPLGRTLVDTEQQVYMSTTDGKNDEVINNFLYSKGISCSSNHLIHYTESNIDVKSMYDVANHVIEGIRNGKSYSLGIYSLGSKINMIAPSDANYSSKSTSNWNEEDGHEVFITGVAPSGFVISSWGEKYTVPFEDLVNGGCWDLNESIITESKNYIQTANHNRENFHK